MNNIKKTEGLLLVGAILFVLAGLLSFLLLLGKTVSDYKTKENTVNTVKEFTENKPKIILNKITWNEISGLKDDNFKGVDAAFKNSCKIFLKRSADEALSKTIPEFGIIKDWKYVCHKIAEIKNEKGEIKKFILENFDPFEIKTYGYGGYNNKGLFTGYYEAELKGSLKKTEKYKYPILAKPDDLVEVDLNQFGINADKKKFFGRVVRGKLEPYPSRADIEKKKQKSAIAWVDNPVDVFILQIQGSGRIVLDDNQELKVGYAASNEKPFVAAGKVMTDKGLLKSGEVTMPNIRKWLLNHPDEAKEIMNLNQRYIFFKKMVGVSPVGAMGIPLVPMRSMAVDPDYIPLGVPLWLDTVDPNNKPLQRVVFAQDVGSAIKGPVRGDFFWGFGEEAFNNAGSMKSKGTYYAILPKR